MATQEKLERQPEPLQHKYLSDGMDMAKDAKGPVSFRVADSSDGRTVHVTVPDPKKFDYHSAQSTEHLDAKLKQDGHNYPERKPAAEMSQKDIVAETRGLHKQFEELNKAYQSSNTPADRNSIREQMKPVVEREHELRAEYNGRNGHQLTQDQAPRKEVASFSR